MSTQPKHHEVAPRSTYLGLPIQHGFNAFHWRTEIAGRPVLPDAPRQKTGPKSKAERTRAVLEFSQKSSITFSKNAQADADKTARLAGRNNSSRSQ